MPVDCSERFLKVRLVSCSSAAVPGFNPGMKRLVQCVINRGLTLAKDCIGTMAAWRLGGLRGDGPCRSRQGTGRGFWGLHWPWASLDAVAMKSGSMIHLLCWMISNRCVAGSVIILFKAVGVLSVCIFENLNPCIAARAPSLALIGRFVTLPFSRYALSQLFFRGALGVISFCRPRAFRAS